MNGFARLFFAVAAILLRGFAWLPFNVADRVLNAARWCEGRAKRPSDRIGDGP